MRGSQGIGSLRALLDELYSKASKKTVAPPAPSGTIQVIAQDLPLATIVAAGHVASASFPVDGVLLANARLFAVEIQIVQTFASGGPYAGSQVSVESTIEGAGSGSLLKSGNGVAASILSQLPGLYGDNIGGFPALSIQANNYFSRGGQQIQVTITAPTGGFLDGLTAGHLIVRGLYAVVPSSV